MLLGEEVLVGWDRGICVYVCQGWNRETRVWPVCGTGGQRTEDMIEMRAGADGADDMDDGDEQEGAAKGCGERDGWEVFPDVIVRSVQRFQFRHGCCSSRWAGRLRLTWIGRKNVRSYGR